MGDFEDLGIRTDITKGLTPQASIFGVDWADAIFVLALFFPVYCFTWMVLPPLPVAVDPIGWLGGPHHLNPPIFDLNPWVPGSIAWAIISLGYLRLRTNKARGYLVDFGRELSAGLEALMGNKNPAIWEAGNPDISIDRYVLDRGTESSLIPTGIDQKDEHQLK